MILFLALVALGLYVAIAAIRAKWSYGTVVAVVLCASLLLMFAVEILGLYTLRKEPGEKPWLVWHGKSWELQFERYRVAPHVARTTR